MDDKLDESIDPASYVSIVRDHMIPDTVQRLIAALTRLGGEQLRQHVVPPTYESALVSIREMHGIDARVLRDRLLETLGWTELCAVLTALRCLEDDCRNGDYPQPLPQDYQGVLLAALEWQVEQFADSDP